MPVSCFNNLNQLRPQDKFSMARQHTDSLILQPNTVNNVTTPCMKAVFLFLSKRLVCWDKRWIDLGKLLTDNGLSFHVLKYLI